MSLCTPCREVRDHTYRAPYHLVHPVSGKPGLFDVRGQAVCPKCGTVWRRKADNTCEIVEG